MFETLPQACFNGNVGGAPVRVCTDAVHDRLCRLGLQKQRLIERSKLEGVVREPVHGIFLWHHLKQPAGGVMFQSGFTWWIKTFLIYYKNSGNVVNYFYKKHAALSPNCSTWAVSVLNSSINLSLLVTHKNNQETDNIWQVWFQSKLILRSSFYFFKPCLSDL